MEIDNVIATHKRSKTHGPDFLINEYLIEYLLPLLRKMFNCILSTGYFSKAWSSANMTFI